MPSTGPVKLSANPKPACHLRMALQVTSFEAAASEHEQQLQASQGALQETEAGHQTALEERAAEIAQLVEAQNSFYQQYEELTASYQELQTHYETANTQLQVRLTTDGRR